jgi:type I restriction enzyme R subunit
MYFDKPFDDLEGFEDDNGYGDIPDNTSTGIDDKGKKYAIRKKLIYENDDRIKAISKFIVERLVSTVYHNIRGKAKAMLAVTSIHAAVMYKLEISKQYAEIVKLKKYERFKDAPVFVLYSDNQHDQSCSSLNNNQTDEMILQNFTIKKNGLMIVVDKLQTGYDEPKLHTLFLDKEVQDINAIQTISRVNRVTRDKNDCKIIDFSYKNANVKSIKKAFEHFSNVVVSDFDPLGDAGKLEIHYTELKQHPLFTTHFSAFVKAKNVPLDVIQLLEIETDFQTYIKTKPDEAKQLKVKINKYFHILNLIEFIIQLDVKYSESGFLDFWFRFSNEYNKLTTTKNTVDDVSIYFDNKIGITAPEDLKDKPKKTSKGGDPPTPGGKYKFNILKVIEKRNKEEEAIEALIKDFEQKIQFLFDYINTCDEGTRLIAKIRDNGTAFDQEDIYKDFAMIYRKFKRRNEKTIGEAFFKETQDMTNQLCDDFEKTILVPYPFNDTVNLAAEDNNLS